MPSTEKLLSIRNLRQYFPLAGRSLLRREGLFVRANESITLDVMRGETLGLVGESGCGKSTLGRTLLQLYAQTGGATVYYGRSLYDFAPRYPADILRRASAYVAELHRREEAARILERECERAGETADAAMLEKKDHAIGEAETLRGRVGAILGGFCTLADPTEGARALLLEYRRARRIAKLGRAMTRLEGKRAATLLRREKRYNREA